jgi:hypothetical protein
MSFSSRPAQARGRFRQKISDEHHIDTLCGFARTYASSRIAQ